MAHWNPNTYLKFGSERLRPALDLMAQIPLATAEQIIDLGCGPGNVTALFKDRWPEADITGIDSSVHMLAEANDLNPDIDWVQTDIAQWQPETAPDLIFSNACLHWLDDHQTLFPKLLSYLSPGGVLAVQMPNNFAAPTHQAIRDVLGNNHPLSPVFPVSDPQAYYDWLIDGCDSLSLWETTYQHVLEGDNPVADWTKGAALRPILDGLKTDAEKQAFEEEYRRQIAKIYPKQSNGKTVMPFKRFFLIAVKKTI